MRLSIKTRRLLSATTTTHRERARGVVKREREREIPHAREERVQRETTLGVVKRKRIGNPFFSRKR